MIKIPKHRKIKIQEPTLVGAYIENELCQKIKLYCLKNKICMQDFISDAINEHIALIITKELKETKELQQ